MIECFDSLVRDNQESLRRFLISLCGGNVALADELAQESFVKAYLHYNSFKGNAKFSTWLFKIAYNLFYDLKRKSTRFKQESLDSLNYQIEESRSNEYDSKYINRSLREALDILKEEEKISILLFYMESKSLKEISQISSIPENTVKSHLRRAKQKMSEYLIKVGYEQ